MKLVRVVALALALAGCGAPDHQPPPEKPPETAQERLDWSLRQLEKDPRSSAGSTRRSSPTAGASTRSRAAR
jgi:hypothetical protein